MSNLVERLRAHAFGDDPEQLENQAAVRIEELEREGRFLVAAIDNMHERGETFTARVSISLSQFRAVLEKRK